MLEPNAAASTPETTTPPPMIPVGQAPDLATYRQARSEGKTEIPNPEAKTDAPPPAEASALTPEQEANSAKPDAEISEAGRKLRMNRSDKRLERVRAENDELARELHRRRTLRSELEREPRPTQPAAAGAESSPAGTATAKAQWKGYDTWAAENPYDAFRDAHPNLIDPYGAYQAKYLEDRDAWRDEQRQIEARETRQREIDQARARETQEKLHASEVEARKQYSDYDAVITPVVRALVESDQQRANDVHDFIAESEVGASVAYQLGKDHAALEAVLSARNQRELYRALLSVEAPIVAARTQPAASPEIKTPPAPHTPSGAGGAASPTHFDAKSDSGSVASWRAARERVAARR